MKVLETQISTRLSSREKELLEKVSAARGQDVSNFVRYAVRRELGLLGYLTDEERKALGVSP